MKIVIIIPICIKMENMKTYITIVQLHDDLNYQTYWEQFVLEKSYYSLIEIIFYIKINMVLFKSILQYMHTRMRILYL